MSTADLKAVATGKVAAQEATDDYSKFKRKLDTLDADLQPLLGGADNVARFKRVVLNAITATPDLLTADRRTLLIACMKAAQDGLLPDGREAVLNIYSTKVKDAQGREMWIKAVQYLPMVHGMVKKLYESGQVTYVDAAAVYEKDDFSFERGESPKLFHKPYLGSEPGPIVCSYLIAKLTNGETKREVMPKRDIDRVRAASKSANGPGWRDWEDQFAIKSVIKRGYKQLPNVPAFEKVVASDNVALGFSQFTSEASMLDRQPPPQQIEHHTIEGVRTDTRELDGEQEAALDAGQRQDAQAETTTATSAKAGATTKKPAATTTGGPTDAEIGHLIVTAKSTDDVDSALSMLNGRTDALALDLRQDAELRKSELAKP